MVSQAPPGKSVITHLRAPGEKVSTEEGKRAEFTGGKARLLL